MKIEYFHASKYGNGAMVAQEFKTIMSAEHDVVNVQHIRDAHAKTMPPADLYVFSWVRLFWSEVAVVLRVCDSVVLTGA